MGKEWLYWVGGGGGRSTRRGRSQGGEKDTPSGCMSAVLQLFDLHPYHFSLHQQPSFKVDSFIPEEPLLLKGVEAPRNSLELEQPFTGDVSLASTTKEEENLKIQMGIQIKTSGSTKSASISKARADDLSSECSNSPAIKTPSVVARLMGLDLLPDAISSPPSSSNHNHSTSNPRSSRSPVVQSQVELLKEEIRSRQHRSSSNRSFFDNDISGTRSLPETPRISSARRSDVDYNHRLSLQINKENFCTGEDFEFSGTKTSRREMRQEDENRSPGQFARQIVKQVKESVSRRVGLDISNTIRSNRDQGVDEHVALIKSKKLSKPLTKTVEESSSSKQSTPSCSPRLRFLEAKNKQLSSTASKSQTSHSPKLSLSPLSSSSPDNNSLSDQSVKVSLKPKSQVQPQENSSHKGKKVASESYGQRLRKRPQTSDMIRNKQEEPFVRSSTTNRANLSDKKCKKTPLSNELLNTNVFPGKKDPSPPSTKLPHKQAQLYEANSSQESKQLLSSCSSHSYEERAKHTLTIQHDSNQDNNGVGGAEFQYISRILKRTGIHKDTSLSFTKWYSPFHPLDPSIFYHLELSYPPTTAAATTSTVLSQRCNRRLIFQLVDELLVQILRPYINLTPWMGSLKHEYCQMNGSQLIDTLSAKLRSFPSANCRVLEDIDALIDGDLCRSELGKSIAYEEEGESLVCEIEREIVQTLMHETAMVMFGMGRPYAVIMDSNV